MTDNKQTDAASETQEQTPNETQATQEASPITKVGEIDKTNETIDVDLFGISVTLPVDQAKELIAKRQEKTKDYKELQDKLNSFQSEKQQLADKLKVETLAKENKLKELQAHFTSELNEKVSKYKNKVIEAELTRQLTSHPEFLNSPEVISDSLKLLKAENSFDLADDDTIKAGEKSVTEVVSEFLISRPSFRKVNKAAHSGSRPAAIQAPKTTNPMGSLTSGLGKMLN